MDRLKDSLFRNWVKGALVLDSVTEPLREFVEPIIERQHQKLKETNLSGQICTECTFKTAGSCKASTCKLLKKAVSQAHRYRRPTFDNTYIKDCWTNPWEFATCFMSPGYEMIHTASVTDFLGLVSVIINNLEFQQYTHENLGDVNNIFSQSRDVRNSIMHTSTFQITKPTLRQMCETITKMLESLVPINFMRESQTPQQKLLQSQTQRAILKVKQIRDDESPISTQDVTHVISQSEDAQERMRKELKSSIAELKEALRQETEKRVQDIELVVHRGIVNIENTKDSSISSIHEEKRRSEEFIKEQLVSATNELKLKQEEGLAAIDERTNESTKRLEDIINREKDDLDTKVQQIQIERCDSESKGEELEKMANELEGKIDDSIQMLKSVTQVCMEKICDVTASFNESLEQSSNTLRNKDTIERRLDVVEEDIENVQSSVTDIKEQIQDFVDKRKLYRCGTLNIDGNTEDHFISGMAKLGQDKLVVVDSNNEVVKIFDLKNNAVVASIKLLRPFDVARIKEDKCVITCGYSLKVLLHEDDSSLKVEKTIEVDAYSYGIVHNNDTFIVSFQGRKPSIKIIDWKGTVLKCFCENDHGQALFASPDYIAFSTSNQIVYISDKSNGQVVCIDVTDGSRTVYKNASFKLPSGIVVDRDERVFVAGQGSHNIHYISSQGTALQTLLEKTRDWKYPQALAYCETENKLYLSADSYKGYGGIIHVYQIV